ncbi:MAG TPA: hypothetical protein DIS62_01390, partial [Candidatus Kerfeldbacteria bacterium]|nr:hypothetical protein [Candidatus Kerfeldbacteria bacterium]
MSSQKRAQQGNDATKPRVAIIGGGIFGATCALILGERFSVTLFERHSDLLMEATRANQYRHHAGYHYPRSPMTIKEIQETAGDFEDFYLRIIDSSAPSYYCIAKDGSLVSPSDFLRVCEQFGLLHDTANPPPEMLNRESVSLCVKTSEKVYNYITLKS